LRSDDLETSAWQLQLAWMLTGEREAFKGPVSPTRPFSLDARTWGAIEIVARYHALDVDPAAFVAAADSFADAARFARRASAWGLGTNWYLNTHYTVSLTYDRTYFVGSNGSGDRDDESVFLSRFEVAF
jgi:phosphate-selective porin OprO/OprP